MIAESKWLLNRGQSDVKVNIYGSPTYLIFKCSLLLNGVVTNAGFAVVSKMRNNLLLRIKVSHFYQVSGYIKKRKIRLTTSTVNTGLFFSVKKKPSKLKQLH